MYCTDFEKKLNLLVRAIKNGLSEKEANDQLEDVLKYTINETEKRKARNEFSAAMEARQGIAA